MEGYTGKYLRINLNTKQFKTQKLNKQHVKLFIGGRGLGLKYFIDEVDPELESLHSDNKVIIATGPLTGKVNGGGYSILTRSSETGLLVTRYSCDAFGKALKNAGFDMLILEGKAKESMRISIGKFGVRFESAEERAVSSHDFVLNEQNICDIRIGSIEFNAENRKDHEINMNKFEWVLTMECGMNEKVNESIKASVWNTRGLNVFSTLDTLDMNSFEGRLKTFIEQSMAQEESLSLEMLKTLAQKIKHKQDLFAVINALGYMDVSEELQIQDYADLLEEKCNMHITANELLKIGERIWNMQKVFNLGAGIYPVMDMLTESKENIGFSDQTSEKYLMQIEVFLQSYYSQRGWTRSGIPVDEKLEQLSIK